MRQLFIDSRDRVAGTSTNFTIQLREQLVVGPDDSYRIDQLRVPLVTPLIQKGVNDTLWFTLTLPAQTGPPAVAAKDQIYFVTLTPGNYSGTDLAALLQTALLTPTSRPIGSVAYPSGTTFSCLYDTHTASLAITCSKSSFHVLTDAEIQALNTSYMSVPTFASKLFVNDYAYAPSGSGVVLTWSYCSVQAIDMMYLTSTRLSNQDTFGPNGSTDALMCAIPNSDFATVMVQSMSPEVFLNCPTMSTSTLDFALRDRNYNLISGLPNISFVLTVTNK